MAACRNPDEAQQLRGLAAEHPNNLSLVRLDVTDEASIQVSQIRHQGFLPPEFRPRERIVDIRALVHHQVSGRSQSHVLAVQVLGYVGATQYIWWSKLHADNHTY